MKPFHYKNADEIHAACALPADLDLCLTFCQVTARAWWLKQRRAQPGYPQYEEAKQQLHQWNELTAIFLELKTAPSAFTAFGELKLP
jgi:hypothetical protein